MGVEYAGQPCVDPLTFHQECVEQQLPTHSWHQKANRFEIPRGEAYGRGYLLMTRESLDAINLDKLHSLEFTDNNGGRIRLRNILFRCATPLNASYANDPTTTYLVEVADVRWLACNPYYANPVSRHYNYWDMSHALTYNWFNGNVAQGIFQWQDILDDLWWSIGVPELGGGAWDADHPQPDALIPPRGFYYPFYSDPFVAPPVPLGAQRPNRSPVLPFSPQSLLNDIRPFERPESFLFSAMPAWKAYHTVLRRIDCAFCMNLVRPTRPKIVVVGERDESLEAARESAMEAGLRIWDGSPIEGTRAKVPAYVAVVFLTTNRVTQSAGEDALPPQAGLSNYYFIPDPPFVVFVPGPDVPGQSLDPNQDIDSQLEKAGIFIWSDFTGAIGSRLPWRMDVLRSSDDIIGLNRPPGVQRLSYRLIWDDYPVHLKSGGPLAKERIILRALERARDFYRQISKDNAPLHEIYDGILSNPGFHPGSQISDLAFYDVGKGMRTEILRRRPEWAEEDTYYYGLRNFLTTNPYQGRDYDLGKYPFPPNI